MAAKKASSAPKEFVPSGNQKITIGKAHKIISGGTIDVYGQLITGVSIAPSDAGLAHPHGADAKLQLALIFGFNEDGACSKVSPPQKVYMPAPSGPADGCEWDPKQFLVWKNIPKDWTTVHVQSEAKPLVKALAVKAADMAPPPFLTDVLCLDWMQLGASQPIDPGTNLQTVWTTMHGGDFGFNQQVSLSNAIRAAYNGRAIPTSSLTAATTVQAVANMIPASV